MTLILTLNPLLAPLINTEFQFLSWLGFFFPIQLRVVQRSWGPLECWLPSSILSVPSERLFRTPQVISSPNLCCFFFLKIDKRGHDLKHILLAILRTFLKPVGEKKRKRESQDKLEQICPWGGPCLLEEWELPGQRLPQTCRWTEPRWCPGRWEQGDWHA